MLEGEVTILNEKNHHLQDEFLTLKGENHDLKTIVVHLERSVVALEDEVLSTKEGNHHLDVWKDSGREFRFNGMLFIWEDKIHQ